MKRDMTQGNPLKLILMFSIPVFIGNVFQLFYNMADTIIVGKLIGVSALAAVGSTGSLMFLVVGFAIGLCTGFGIPISQAFGARDIDGVKRYIVNSFMLTVMISVVMTLLACISATWLLQVMKTPEDIMKEAYEYLFIMFAGIGVTMFYNLLACISRALGDSRTPLYFLIMASVLNVILDITFIQVFRMGTAGPALATVLAQAVSAVCCLLYMYKQLDIMQIKRSEMKADKRAMKKLFFTGLPMALQTSITAIGSITIQVAVNSFGSGIVAAVTTAQKALMLLMQPFETLGIIITTYCGQNLGAGKYSRIKKGMLQTCFIMSIYFLLAIAILYFFGNHIAMLFIKKEEAGILPQVRQYMMTNGVFLWALGLLFIFRNGIQGLGYTTQAMAAGVSELIARTMVALVFVDMFGFRAICYANPIAWFSAAVLVMLIFLYVWKKKFKKAMAAEEARE